MRYTVVIIFVLTILWFSRENDYHSQTHWKVDRNIITQISNGKALSNSPYVFGKHLVFFFAFQNCHVMLTEVSLWIQLSLITPWCVDILQERQWGFPSCCHSLHVFMQVNFTTAILEFSFCTVKQSHKHINIYYNPLSPPVIISSWLCCSAKTGEH